MPAFKYPRTSQPQGAAAEIDWASPLTSGLSLLVDQYGRDLVSSRALTATGSLSSRVTEKGIGRSNGGIAYLTSQSRTFVAPTNTAFSIIGEIALNATGQTNKYLAYAESGTGGYTQAALIFGYVANSIEIYANKATGTDPRSGSAIAITDTKVHTFGYSYDGATFCGYLDGKEVFSRSISFSLGIPDLDLTGSLYSASALDVVNVTILKWATYSRGIGPNALRQLTANPNQLVKPQARTLWIPGTVSGGGTTSATVTQSDSADSTSLSATVTTGATIASSDSADTQAVAAARWMTAQLASSDRADTQSVTAAVGSITNAAVSQVNGGDATAITMANWMTAQLASSDRADTQSVAATAGGITLAGIDQSDGSDATAITMANWTSALIAHGDAPDTTAVTGNIVGVTSASVAAFDAADTQAITTLVTTGAVIVGTDGADTALVSAACWTTAILAAVNGADTTNIVGSIPGTAVYPLESQVQAGVQYGPTGADFTGTLTGGSGPSAADIAAAVIAAAQVTPIWADARRMNGAVVQGDGSEANLWRGANV